MTLATPHGPRFVRRRAAFAATPVSRLAGCLAIAVGSAILAAWATDMGDLASLFPGINRMNPVTALCVAVLGAAPAAPRPARRRRGR